MKDEVDFKHEDKHYSFLQVTLSFLVSVAKYAQSTQSNNFALSLQYLKKEVNVEVDCLHADNHQNFLHVDTMMGMARHVQSTQSNKFAMSLKYLKKEMKDGVDFLHGDKTYLSTNRCCHFWWFRLGMLKVPRTTSLQYLFNISRKK